MSGLSVQPNGRVAFRIVHADEDLAVVSKPAGVVTQPGKGHEGDSLLNGLFARFGARLQRLGAARDFGLLHRLDREASGLLVVAFGARSYDALRLAFEERRIGKYYWAVVHGMPRRSNGIVRRPIEEMQTRRREGRYAAHGSMMKLGRVSGAGKPAATAYRVLGSSRGVSLIECRTLTGRLHQVRVHMASIRCPILGDALYAPAGASALSPRLALHAHRLVIPHPKGQVLDCRTVWPGDLRGLLVRFALQRPAASTRAMFRATGPVEGNEEINDDGVGDEEPGIGQ